MPKKRKSEVLELTETHEDIQESIPLVPKNEDDAIIERGDLEYAQKFRGESSQKWYILVWLTTIWFSTYHCIFSADALEDSLIDQFNFSSEQFALLSSLIFGMALVTALFCPTLIQKLGLYYTVLIGQIILTIGQSLFFTGIYINSKILMYFSRTLLGISLGIDDVCVNSILSLWFGRTRWSSLAFMILGSGLEIGVVTCRYCLVPLKELFNNLAYPFLLGVIFSIISIISIIIIKYIDNLLINDVNTPLIVRNSKTNDLDHNFTLISKFSLETWLIIIYISIGFSNIVTFFTQMEEPLIKKFSMSEWTADLALSLSSLLGVCLGPLWGWLAGKYGHLSYFQIIGMILMFMSSLWLGLTPSKSDSSAAWICMILFILSAEFFFTSFAGLFMLCPVQLISLANAINTVFYLGGGFIEIYIFGVIGDETDSFNGSILMISILSLIAFILAVAIHYIDKRSNGPLHKGFLNN